MPRTKTAAADFLVEFDSLPAHSHITDSIKKPFRELAEFYGFEKISTSLFENQKIFASLIKAGLLEERPPLFCRTRVGTEFMLRVSGALSILRAYVTHKMNDLPHPIKFFFEGEAFSMVRGRDGAFRMTPEWGMVMLGEDGPVAEAQMVQVVWKALGESSTAREGVELRINATGCGSCRPAFRSAFSSYYRTRLLRLCKSCKRFFKRTPVKVLLCTEEKCQIISNNAPQVLDFLCDICKKHLKGFLEFLEEGQIPYFLDRKFFKDGTWFGELIFEFRKRIKPVEGKENKEIESLLVEGGRMSRAGEIISGRRLDAVGAQLNLNSLQELFLKLSTPASTARPKVFLVQLGELAKRKSLALMEELRQGEIEVDETLGRDSVKSQLKVAELVGAEIALILGQKEALDNTVIVREVQSGIQETIPQEKLIEFLRKKLKK